MKKNHWLLFFFCLFLHTGRLKAAAGFAPAEEKADRPAVTYRLSMPQPQTHYVAVEMRVEAPLSTTPDPTAYLDVKMPVWTPGSYLIREFAKNVEDFSAFRGDTPLKAEKISKNTWRIASGGGPVTIQYSVYAFELSVRTSYVDDTHAFISGAGIFLYVDSLRSQPHRVTVEPYRDWKTVTTALPLVAGQANTFEAPDFDILVDSPIEIGNHRTFRFTAAGIPHTVAMVGEVQFNERQLAEDMKKVCEAATAVIGEHPCRDYTFIIHHVAPGTDGGGLEHLNSTTLQVLRTAYQPGKNYQDFLGLVAHEYFHLWNVKRIRPKALGPFDYENENYTHLLWVAEGFTSFYQSHLLRRSGHLSAQEYLQKVASEISGIENLPGNRVQSVAESSWDAWIKYYRPNENSTNSTISYYSKGSVLGGLMNLTILAGSDGRRNLDDLMRLLYDTYYKKEKRGFTDEEFQAAAEQVAGRSLKDFFQRYVSGTEPIDYEAFFKPVGLRLVDVALRQRAFLGATTRYLNGAFLVTRVHRDSPAWTAGLSVGDYILSINRNRIAGDDLAKALISYKPGDSISVEINRNGLLRTIPVRLADTPLSAFRLEPIPNATPQQKALFRKWLVAEQP